MIYLIAGSDFNKANNAFNKYVNILRDKQPGASVFEFGPEEFNVASFEEVVLGETLFLTKHIVLARRLSESEEALNLVTSLAPKMAEAPSVFLFYETDEQSELVKNLSSLAKETKIFTQKINTKPEFNVFSLTDALGARDRQKLWVTYQTALRSGVKAEEVFWKLSWQLKTMMVVMTATDPQATGLKPFVVNKALKASRNFSLLELKNLYRRFTQLLNSTYPDSEEFSFGLEKIILTI